MLSRSDLIHVVGKRNDIMIDSELHDVFRRFLLHELEVKVVKNPFMKTVHYRSRIEASPAIISEVRSYGS